jgi:DNA-binding transcriptional LysR family regulator
MRLRVQVRSFDAMCHMIAANLGIGIVPLAACRAQVANLNLKAVRLDEDWAHRRLLLATKPGDALAPAADLLLRHLEGLASANGAAARVAPAPYAGRTRGTSNSRPTKARA